MNTTQGFIKNYQLLKEDSKVDDLLDFSALAGRFYKKIISVAAPAIFGLVGPFGSGKSTMINQVIKDHEGDRRWVEFDAWKYPERKDLWEGFVLEFAKEISPDEYRKVDLKIKGTQNNDIKTLIKTLSKIPGFAALEGLTHFFETSPARRVDEIQAILYDQIRKINKDLFIVVEDVDRSGDAGVFFLETLKQFLRSHNFNKKIVVIVPMANENYYKNLESYLKCIDYFDFFQPEKVKLDRFVDEVFCDGLFEGQFNRQGDNMLIWSGRNRRIQTISFLEGLFREQTRTTMRLLKLIIRKADLVYKNQIEDGMYPDFRVTLCLEAAKYFNIEDKSDIKYFNDFKRRGVVTRGNIFSSFLYAMLTNRESIYERRLANSGEKEMLLTSPHDFKFIERVENDTQRYPSYPWEYYDHEKGLGIAKFYARY